MVCVYRPEPCAGAAAARVSANYAGRGAFLLFFLVIVAASAQIVQELTSRGCAGARWRGTSTAASRCQPGWSARSPRRWSAGCCSGSRPSRLARRWPIGFVAGGCGTLGELRDEGAEARRRRALTGATSSSVTGAVGLLDRVAPLCFAAPVFFHSVRWYFQRLRSSMRILGIDPGLQTTGFGVVEVDGRDAGLRGQRHHPHRRSVARRPAGAAEDHLRRRARGGRALPAGVRVGRDRLRQRQPAEHAAARPGARRRAGRAGVRRAAGGRVHRAADEEGHRRPRPGAQAAGAADGDAAARAARRCPARTRPTRSAWRSRTPMPARRSPRWPGRRRWHRARMPSTAAAERIDHPYALRAPPSRGAAGGPAEPTAASA